MAVINGPTGKITALNGPNGSVALVAPDDAAPFFASARQGKRATLHLTGKRGRRSTFNFVGRIDTARDVGLVISTPQSGWPICAGCVAAWRRLAR